MGSHLITWVGGFNILSLQKKHAKMYESHLNHDKSILLKQNLILFLYR